MDCHIEIFHGGQWLDAAHAHFSGVVRQGFRASSCVFEYDFDYAFADAPSPVSLRFPVDAARHVLHSWPTFLYDLVPQGNGRRFLLERLGLGDHQAADLPLLCAGAFNPIGCLRIKEAVDYYRGHVEQHASINEGFELDDLLARDQKFHEEMMVHGMLATGGTGVQGVAPKYLLTKAKNGRWYPDAALADEDAAEHYIVKRPRGTKLDDQKVLRNEAAYMQVARLMGLRTHALPELHGEMLFVPRFDRQTSGTKVRRFHQESLASIAGLAGFGFQANQFILVDAIRRVVDSPLEETIEFIQRDILNLAMKNLDNHARNTAVQTVDGVTRLTPLFDFAPMYLDPEGIVRSARWYHRETKKEISHWQDVLPHLLLPEAEYLEVVNSLVAFGEKLSDLPAHMESAGVDADIIAFLRPSIAAQQAQLSALR